MLGRSGSIIPLELLTGLQGYSRAIQLRIFGDDFSHRIDLFRNLPIASLDKMTLKEKVDDIGTKAPEEADAE